LSIVCLGFEAGGPDNTLNIYPWSVIGNESSISVSISHTSCFERNKAALLMNVYCGGHKPCPYGGVGISNPGYWGMVRKFIYTSHSNTHYNLFHHIFLVFVLCKFKSNINNNDSKKGSYNHHTVFLHGVTFFHVQNFEQGKRYKVVYHVKSETKFDFQLSFTGVDVIKVSSNTR